MIPISYYEGLAKNCCFCRIPSFCWTELRGRNPSQQVPCCPECAHVAHPRDVPQREEWSRRETIAAHGEKFKIACPPIGESDDSILW